jgi:hypothetical protein
VPICTPHPMPVRPCPSVLVFRLKLAGRRVMVTKVT